jgi:transcriptional regulator with XRE-family HTH domain
MERMPTKAKNRASDALNLSLCEQWKARRLELGLTQHDVADILGVSQPTYASIETGYASPTTKQITKVCRALKLKLSLRLDKA